MKKNFLLLALNKQNNFLLKLSSLAPTIFFDGMREDRDKLESAYAMHPDVQFIEFTYEPERNFYGKHSVNYWHNLGRLLGSAFLKEEIQYLLFLDVDEIVDAQEFTSWLKAFDFRKFDAFRLACYWYFRESCYQATSYEDTPLFIKRDRVTYEGLMHSMERAGTFFEVRGEKLRYAKSLRGDPMVHHYSWVRSKEQMLRKVLSWGHRDERNWTQLVELEFAHPFSGRDFVHGYDFLTVKPRFLMKEAKKSEKKMQKSQNVTYLSTRAIHQIDLENI